VVLKGRGLLIEGFLIRAGLLTYLISSGFNRRFSNLDCLLKVAQVSHSLTMLRLQRCIDRTIAIAFENAAKRSGHLDDRQPMSGSRLSRLWLMN
jgi:hypothetical protein